MGVLFENVVSKDDLIVIQDHPDLQLGTGDFSVSFVLFPTDNNEQCFVLGKDTFNGGGFVGWFFMFNTTSSPANNVMRFSTRNNATFNNSVDSLNTYPVNTWYHIVCVRESGTLKIYVDGVLDNSQAEGGSTNITNTVELKLGKFDEQSGPSANWYQGGLEEFALWKGLALDQTDVNALYNPRIKYTPRNMHRSNLKCYLPLDEVGDGVSADGVTFRDLSGLNHVGVGDDGANNTGLTGLAGEVLSYTTGPVFVVPAVEVTGRLSRYHNLTGLGGQGQILSNPLG